MTFESFVEELLEHLRFDHDVSEDTIQSRATFELWHDHLVGHAMAEGRR